MSERDHGTRWTAIWLALFASSAVYFLSSGEADNDLWGHVFFGRAIVAAGQVLDRDSYSYTAPGAPWINHEWLSQVLLYAGYRLGGGPALLLLKLVVGLCTAALIGRRMRQRTRSAWTWGASGILVLAVLARGFAIRPQIFSYALFALLLAWLDADWPRRSWRHGAAVVALMVLWVNLHGGFLLGIGVLALYAGAQRLADGRGGAGAEWVLLGALGAVLANPYGYRLIGSVLNELTAEHPITEWQPAHSGDPALATFYLLLVVFALTLWWAPRGRRSWETVAALAAAVLALRQQRQTPVFAIAVAAVLVSQLDAAAAVVRRRWLLRLSAPAQALLGAGLVGLAIFQLIVASATLVRRRFQVTFDAHDYPVAAVQALAARRMTMNLAVPLDWGEYALWHLAPAAKVSLDGRFRISYPAQVIRDNFAFFAGADGWSRLLRRYPTDAVLLPRASGCPIRSEPGWQRVFGDPVAELYVHADRAGAFGDLNGTAKVENVFP